MAPLTKTLLSLAHFSLPPRSPTADEASQLSPLEIGMTLRARDPSKETQYDPGKGIVKATDINNTVIFVLFGLLGAGLVCTSIWFFFWAKNGGFRFRKGDWEDYKSTVLRRKGPNGTTLSGATRSTALGGGSIVGSQGSMDDFEDPEKAETFGRRKKRDKKNKNSHDQDVRAYRHEKVAKVGGLNREADGSYHDYTSSEMSEVSGAQPHYKASHRQDDHTPRRPTGRQPSYTLGSEATFSVVSDDSHRPLRSSPQHNHHSSTSTPAGAPRYSRHPQSSHRAPTTPSHHRYSSRASAPGSSYTEPLDFESRYPESEAGTEQARNTKAYFHPIPGLSKNTGGGFRRGAEVGEIA